jgi:predicted nucleotidyltransferase
MMWMAKKTLKRPESLVVAYSNKRWDILHQLREKAKEIMEPLNKSNLQPIVHGSIARGDISSKSDIDIFVPTQTSSFTIQNTLTKANITPTRLYVVQATPNYAMKAHIEIDEGTTVSFPLMKLRKVEREFYKFGGEINLGDLKKDLRVSGVDKRLMFIEPTEEGHVESTIVGREEHVANVLGVSVETVLDRVHALLRRDDVGRTGVFMKQEIPEGKTFEMLLEELAKKNPAVRRRLTSQL